MMIIIIISICREQQNRLSPAQVNTGKSVRLLDIIIQRRVSLFQGQGWEKKEPFISTIVFLFVITATPSVGLSQSCLFFLPFWKNLLIFDLYSNYFFFLLLFKALDTTVLTVKVFTPWGFTVCSLCHALRQALLTLRLVKQRMSACERVTLRDKENEKLLLNRAERDEAEGGSAALRVESTPKLIQLHQSQSHDPLSGQSQLEDECVRNGLSMYLCVFVQFVSLSLQQGHKSQLGGWVSDRGEREVTRAWMRQSPKSTSPCRIWEVVITRSGNCSETPGLKSNDTQTLASRAFWQANGWITCFLGKINTQTFTFDHRSLKNLPTKPQNHLLTFL